MAIAENPLVIMLSVSGGGAVQPVQILVVVAAIPMEQLTSNVVKKRTGIGLNFED